jgi:hypothetical protein
VEAATTALSQLRVTVSESPSSFGQPKTWVKYQFPAVGEPAFACFRPFVGPPRALPASLVAPEFGRFLELAACDLAALGRCDTESACLARLLDAMHRYHKLEATLQAEVNAALSAFLGRELRPLRPNQFSSSSTTDGSLVISVGGIDVLVALLEYKRDAFAGSCDPKFQLVRELQMFWEAPERECCALHAADACPCLLIEVAGPLMRVSAAASLYANRVQAEPLTPFLHVLLVRDQPAYMARLLAALRALRETVDGLAAYYAARGAELPVDGPPPAARDGRVALPHPLRDGAQFLDVEHLCDDKLLYAATHVPSARRVCVKFSRHAYGADVHAVWAAAGLAPQLISHARLPGGLHMVVMELLDVASGWRVLRQLPRGAAANAAHGAALAALQRAHAAPLPCGGRGAHGDCRAVNVMVRLAPAVPAAGGGGTAPEWEVRFVDFDGAGAEGRRLYPPLMSPAVRWPVGALPGEPLKQEHDVALLAGER